MTVEKLLFGLAIFVIAGNVLSQIAKRLGWTRVQWFIEALTGFAIDAMGRAAAAPKNANVIQEVAKQIANAQESPHVTLNVVTPATPAALDLKATLGTATTDPGLPPIQDAIPTPPLGLRRSTPGAPRPATRPPALDDEPTPPDPPKEAA